MQSDDDLNASNNKSVLKVLNEFYVLSGLGINKSKTMLSIFGSTLDKSDLVGSLCLKWCTKFTLLGLDFDQCLEEMDENFEKAVGKMQKVAKNGGIGT